jgi:hypothetical protein
MALEHMNHEEQLEFLLKALQRGFNIPEPKIVGNTIEFEMDGATYIVKIRKAS